MTWRDMYREQYLVQNLALEGRGRLWGQCAMCAGSALFRCLDCVGACSFCRSCAVKAHRSAPLHILEVSTEWCGESSVTDTDQHIQEWKNTHFQRVTLKDLGLRVQLGHSFGQYCPFRDSGNKDFVVIGMNGIHRVNVDFCGCPGHPEPFIQLLELRWWPSTPIAPQTAATMDVLRKFHILNLQARLPPTEFYRGLERMADGAGLVDLPVS